MPNQDRHLPGHRDPSRPPSSASSCCAPQPLFSCPAACPLNPVTRFAIGRRQVTMTDRDEQSVIRSLQSAHNEYLRDSCRRLKHVPARRSPVRVCWSCVGRPGAGAMVSMGPAAGTASPAGCVRAWQLPGGARPGPPGRRRRWPAGHRRQCHVRMSSLPRWSTGFIDLVLLRLSSVLFRSAPAPCGSLSCSG